MSDVLLRFVRWRKIPFDPKKTWDMGSKFKPIRFFVVFFWKRWTCHVMCAVWIEDA